MSGPLRPYPAADTTRRGWTLIELLLAVIIALLVISLLFSIYHTVLTATRQQATRHQQDETAHAVRQLSHDLQAAFYPADDTNCVMRLRQDDGLHLAWCATLLGTQEYTPRWFDITQVHYYTATNGTTVSLLRETTPLVGPASGQPPASDEILHDIKAIQIQLFDGETWQEAWPVDDPPVLPRAARISLQTGIGTAITTDVFIPAGSTLSPH